MQYAVSGITDSLTLLQHPETVTHYTTFSVAVCLSVSRCSFGSDGIPSFQLDRLQAAMNAAAQIVFHKVAMIIPLCYSTACTGFVCRSAYPSSCRHGLPLRPWTWTRLPVRRPSAGRQDFWSTAPAVIVDVGIGRPVYTTVHCRRPSVSRRCGTNMEQFAS